jgi:hypothetical protein
MQHLVCERSCLQWPERTSNSAQLRRAVGQTAGRTFLQSSSWAVTAKTKGWPGYSNRATACPLHPRGHRIQMRAHCRPTRAAAIALKMATCLNSLRGEYEAPSRQGPESAVTRCAIGRIAVRAFIWLASLSRRAKSRQRSEQNFCWRACRLTFRPQAWQRNVSNREPTNPLFLSSKNNGLQGQKSGSSILGGHRWPNPPRIDRDLVRKIVRAEIGDTR